MGLSVEKKQAINEQIRQEYGDVVSRDQLLSFAARAGVTPYWISTDPANRTNDRGKYRVPVAGAIMSIAPDTSMPESDPIVGVDDPLPTNLSNVLPMRPQKTEQDKVMDALVHEASLMSVVPAIDPAYEPFGDYAMIRNIIESQIFFPVFITGLSGNGKTMGIEQACASLGREFLNLVVTAETDEDDLIGGFRLRNGATYFEPGPVLVAMLRGSPMVLNELDLASPKIMCLQRVLEGKPVTVKKLGIIVTPTKGFTVFATANTKGRGSDDGKFIGTGLLNEAFLERFPITVEQEYPNVETEKKILRKAYQKMGGKMDATTTEYFNTLAKWAEGIRKLYFEQGIDDLISTRRLVHIVTAYAIFTKKSGPEDAQQQALSLCVNRFDPKVRDAMADYYNKLAPDAVAPDTVGDGAAVLDPGLD